MSEDTENTNSKAKVRTFAMDLAAKRAETPRPKSEEVKKKTVSPKEAAHETLIKEPEIKVPVPKINKDKLKPIPREPEIKLPNKAPKINLKNTPVTIASPIPRPEKIKTPTSPKKVTAPKKIPAFHELSKNKPKDKKAVIHNDTKTSVDSENKSGGLLQSLKSLFKSFGLGSRRSKAPTYTVPDTTRRKGVIQKATSKSGAIFTADNETLKESIRKRQARENLEEDSETSWSPYTEAGYNLLESPDPIQPANVRVEFKNRVASEMGPVPEIPEEPTPTPKAPASTKEVVNEKVFTEESKPVTLDQTVKPATDARPEPTPVPAQPATEPNKPKRHQSIIEKFASLNTNTQALSLLGVITSVFVLIFVTNLLISALSPSVTVTETASHIIITTAEQISVDLTSIEELNLIEEMSNKVIAKPGSLAEIAVTDENKNEVTPETVFAAAGFKPPASLIKSVTAIRFIANDSTRPAILMTIVDRENVYGDMLKWEDAMPTEMSPLYLKDSQSLTESKFIDKNIAGLDIRVLKGNNEEVFVYGLVNDNTLLVAQNSVIFNQLAKEIIQNN